VRQAFYEKIFSAKRPVLERFELFADLTHAEQSLTSEIHGRVCGCPVFSVGCEMAGQDKNIRAVCDDLRRGQEHYLEKALHDMVAEKLLPATADLKVRSHELNAYIQGQLMLARIQNDLTLLERDLKAGLLIMAGI
jgi:TetR/AcrR family transcriptional repressor of nem operon